MRAAVGGNWLRAWEPWIDPHVHSLLISRSHLTVVGMNQRLRHMLHILSADFQRLQGCRFVDDGQRCFHVRRSCREVMQRLHSFFLVELEEGELQGDTDSWEQEVDDQDSEEDLGGSHPDISIGTQDYLSDFHYKKLEPVAGWQENVPQTTK